MLRDAGVGESPRLAIIYYPHMAFRKKMELPEKLNYTIWI